MGQNGYQVDLAALDKAANGVQDAHDALASLLPGGLVGGHYATAGTAADLLTDLGLSEQELGHGGLADAWKGFLSRRSWDLRTRLKEGEHMVGHLQDSRSTYQKVEDSVSGILKSAVEDIQGDSSTTNAAEKSWAQVGQDVRPDWTKGVSYNEQQVTQAEHALQADGSSIVQDANTETDLPILGAMTPELQQAQQLDGR